MSPGRITIFAAFVVSTLAACGGGRGLSIPDSGGVVQCTAAYSPIPMTLPEDENRSKISWPEAGGGATLSEGLYEYYNVEFFVDNVETGFKFHAAEDFDGEESTIRRKCARGTRSLESGMKWETEFPAQFEVQASGKTTSATKVFLVEYSDRLNVEVTEDVEPLPDPPSKVTDEQNFASQLYTSKLPDSGETIYEFRLEDSSGPMKRYTVIRYKKVER